MSSQVAWSEQGARAALRAIAWGAPTPRTRAPSVALPLTGPVLIGLRARLAPDGRLEMLLSNAGGGRGIYVTDWDAIRQQAMPSLHDLRLVELLQAEAGTPLTPGRVRAAALRVAMEGHAGRAAARLARQAVAAGHEQLLRLRSHLLLALARALDMPGSHAVRDDPWHVGLEAQRSWLENAPGAIAAQLRGAPVAPAAAGTSSDRIGQAWSAGAVATAVEALAADAAGLGFGPHRDRHRLPRILELLGQAGSIGKGPLAASLGARHALAAEALRRARALLDAPLVLLADWRRCPSEIGNTLTQPDWLLDGWDRLCLVHADPAFERGLRRGLAQLLTHDLDTRPAPERAAAERDGIGCEATDMQSASIATLDRLERHERLRRAELLLDDPEFGQAGPDRARTGP